MRTMITSTRKMSHCCQYRDAFEICKTKINALERDTFRMKLLYTHRSSLVVDDVIVVRVGTPNRSMPAQPGVCTESIWKEESKLEIVVTSEKRRVSTYGYSMVRFTG